MKDKIIQIMATDTTEDARTLALSESGKTYELTYEKVRNDGDLNYHWKLKGWVLLVDSPELPKTP